MTALVLTFLGSTPDWRGDVKGAISENPSILFILFVFNTKLDDAWCQSRVRGTWPAWHVMRRRPGTEVVFVSVCFKYVEFFHHANAESKHHRLFSYVWIRHECIYKFWTCPWWWWCHDEVVNRSWRHTDQTIVKNPSNPKIQQQQQFILSHPYWQQSSLQHCYLATGQ